VPQINSGVKLRLTALGVAAGLAGVLIAVIVLELQQKAVVTRARLGEMDLESFRIADLFKEKLRQANDQMRRHCTDEDPRAWDEFLKSGAGLKGWVDAETARLKAPGEQKLLKDMDTALTAYVEKALAVHAVMTTNRARQGATVGEFNQFLDQARRFMDLSQELGRRHYESRNQVVEHTSRALTELRMSVLGLLGLLFLFAGALAVSVYKNLIAPLRVKLVETQAQVERNEKLASLGLLAAGVAHEIRNPLTAIKTALFLQQKKFQPGSRERADGEIVEREIVRLDRIVTNFLQFARPTDPQPAIMRADFPLQEAEALLAPQLTEAGIQLVREESSPMQIRADPAQLKQVLINLVQNAADSMTNGGRITLRARPSRKSTPEGESDVVVLEVADTGKGIEPAVEKRLFDPFFTTKENGTGLGLAIAARIVEINGGALQYQTQVNHGSTFGIVMPRVTEAAR
jgi:signal transduction histidine kinase